MVDILARALGRHAQHGNNRTVAGMEFEGLGLYSVLSLALEAVEIRAGHRSGPLGGFYNLRLEPDGNVEITDPGGSPVRWVVDAGTLAVLASISTDQHRIGLDREYRRARWAGHEPLPSFLVPYLDNRTDEQIVEMLQPASDYDAGGPAHDTCYNSCPACKQIRQAAQ